MISIKFNTKVTANKWFLPLVWASKIITEGLAEGKIRPQCVSTLMSELCKVIFCMLYFQWTPCVASKKSKFAFVAFLSSCVLPMLGRG